MMNYQNNRYPTNSQNLIPPTMSPSYQSFLNTLVKSNDLILLDTGTILKGEPFEMLLKDLILILRRHSKQITILQSVMEELRSMSVGTDTHKRMKATRALDLIRILQNNNVIILRGSPNTEESGSAGIIKYVSKNIYEKNILVLTQSGDLAADCSLFSQIRSCRMEYTVTVKRISNQYGQLNSFNSPDSRTEVVHAERVSARNNAESSQYSDLFRKLGL
ncbi:MAG: hypothetical protein IJB59_14545 [Oscillospiraceae bacterium]|nr:hypothetical protein [Oscillospiraceae bacterium]